MPLIEKLRHRLQEPLPHADIRKEGISEILVNFILKAREKNIGRFETHPPRPCAVLMILYKKKDIWHIPLIVRPKNSRVHAGQLAFPGGKKEEQDLNLQMTALRETWEEVGVKVPDHQVIGSLSPVYIPPSNTMVTPYLAYLDKAPTFTLQPTEVAEVVEASLDELAKVENARVKEVIMENGMPLPLPAFQIEQHLVWGGTARMISELNKMI